jgi:hypothetical protein
MKMRHGLGTYQTIAHILLEVGLWSSPDIPIAGEFGAQTTQRLPSKQYRAILGRVNISPVEWRLVLRNLRGIVQPLGYLLEVYPGHGRIAKRRNKMNVRELWYHICR